MTKFKQWECQVVAKKMVSRVQGKRNGSWRYSKLLLTDEGDVRDLLTPSAVITRRISLLWLRDILWPCPMAQAKRGQVLGGVGFGTILDSPCTQLFNHQVLLISLQNDYPVHFLHLHRDCLSSSHHHHMPGRVQPLPKQSSCFPPIPSSHREWQDLRGSTA